jgi:RND family efflux transporter MFP subunit
MKKQTIGLWIGAAAIVAAGIWYVNAGGSKDAAPARGGNGGAGQPTLVNVVSPVRQDVPVVEQANGTVTPLSSVELHAQTTSAISAVHIKEGQFVKKGQRMFSLDDRSDRANVERAQAQVARDQAALADIERQYKRSQELFEQKFIAQSQVDTLRSQVESARATLKANQAAAQASRVSAGYTSINAPMSGRVGAINVFPGTLAQPSLALTTVTQLDPITVSFTLPESALADLLAAQRAGKVEVSASSGADTTVKGVLSFIDNTVDPASGTIRVKAQFANPDSRLWPGQYVNTKVTTRVLKDAVVVPLSAVVTSVRGTFVYVADGDSARQLPVQKLLTFGPNVAVSGLKGDEKVITEGKQNLRPGGKIRLAGAARGDKK